MKQQAFLLFQFDLETNAVEYLQFDSDRDDRSRIDCDLDPDILGAFEREDRVRKVTGDLGLHKSQRNDGGEEHDLPVKQARTRQIAANQAINAEIDEWREKPDVVFVNRHCAQLA